MKKFILGFILFTMIVVGIKAKNNTEIVPYFQIDVPAIQITVPAPFPCNLPAPHSPGGQMTYAVCITGPETHWTCKDEYRVLLYSQDGNRHCINFGTIQSIVQNYTYTLSTGNTQKLENK